SPRPRKCSTMRLRRKSPPTWIYRPQQANEAYEPTIRRRMRATVFVTSAHGKPPSASRARVADLLSADEEASEEARIEGVEVIERRQAGAIKELHLGRP